MKRNVLIFSFLALFSVSAFCSVIGAWAKVLGKDGNDVFTSVVPLDDGSYILGGYSTSRGDEENCWIVKLDRSGALVSEGLYNFGGEDRVTSIAKLPDGSVYAAGKLNAFGSDGAFISKIKSNGNIDFINKFAFTYTTSVKSVRLDGATPYSAGFSGSDSFIEKGDNVISNNIVSDARIYVFILNPNGGFIAAGEKDDKPLLIFFDSNLKVSKAYYISAGANFSNGRCSSIARLQSGAFAICGEFSSSSNYNSIFICKMSTDYNLIWMNVLESREDSSAKGVISTKSGDILLFGTFRPTSGDPFDGYASLWGSDGSLLWQKRYGGSANDEIWCAASSSDGGYLLAGKTKSYGRNGENGFVIKTDELGDIDPTCDFIKSANLSVTVAEPQKDSVNLTEYSPSPSLNPVKQQDKEPLGTADLLCYNGPAIISVTKKADPFRLVLSGANFRNGFSVYIGESSTPWTKTAYIDGTKVVLKGGNSLKSQFPKGVPTLIRLFNSDGRGCEITYTR
ncbi:MAG: hypothetical protein ACE14Q_03410 [Acidobacteriota bacterium]